jgi:cold shock CspA family protein
MDQSDNTNSLPQTEEPVATTTTTSTMPNIPPEYTVLVERLTGTVKWFNNRAGFGFITVCEPGEYENKEIFVHWSSIRVSNSQYKYLFQGEYVDFTLVKANNSEHEYQAMYVSGVRGGPIMCETRRSSNGSPERRSKFRSNRPPRGPPRDEDNEELRGRDRDNRRPRTRSNGTRNSENATNSQSADLLDYVKVQSKRTRRTNDNSAPRKTK